MVPDGAEPPPLAQFLVICFELLKFLLCLEDVSC